MTLNSPKCLMYELYTSRGGYSENNSGSNSLPMIPAPYLFDS